MHPPSPSFDHLRSQLDEWKQAGLLRPPQALSEDQFRIEAPNTILPVVQALAQTLTEAGLPADVMADLDEQLAIGLHVASFNLTLWLSPATNPAYLRATAAGGSRGADVTEWFIPYHKIRGRGLEQELHQATVRRLAPGRCP